MTGEAAYTLTTDDTWRVRDKTFRTVDHYTWRVNENDPANSLFMQRNQILPVRVLVIDGLCHRSSSETTLNLSYTRRQTKNGTMVAEKTWNKIITRMSHWNILTFWSSRDDVISRGQPFQAIDEPCIRKFCLGCRCREGEQDGCVLFVDDGIAMLATVTKWFLSLLHVKPGKRGVRCL